MKVTGYPAIQPSKNDSLSGFECLQRETFRFTSKELDDETGLYYYGARYLDPTTSRWMSVDPAGPSLANPMRDGFSAVEAGNWYSYVSNNPINYTDPSGMYEIEDGDTLTKIAGQDKTTVEDLLKLNPQVTDKDKIFAGDNLTLPSEVKKQEEVLTNNESRLDELEPQQTGSSTGNTPTPVPQSDSSGFTKDQFYGVLELSAGIVIAGLSIAAASALAPTTMGSSAWVGYNGVLTGGALFAHGLSRAMGNGNQPVSSDVASSFTPPIAELGKIRRRRK